MFLFVSSFTSLDGLNEWSVENNLIFLHDDQKGFYWFFLVFLLLSLRKILTFIMYFFRFNYLLSLNIFSFFFADPFTRKFNNKRKFLALKPRSYSAIAFTGGWERNQIQFMQSKQAKFPRKIQFTFNSA